MSLIDETLPNTTTPQWEQPVVVNVSIPLVGKAQKLVATRAAAAGLEQEINDATDMFAALQLAAESNDVGQIVEVLGLDISDVSLPKEKQSKLWAVARVQAQKINDKLLAAAQKTQAEQQAIFDQQYNEALEQYKAEVKRLEEEAADRKAANISPIEDFFDPNKNSIVRSFRSAGGMGLAGFIESMNFEWLDNQNILWDIDKGAPMLCKVTLQFSPIHDISPGLDSQGYNRAPVYPVGHFNHSYEEHDKGPED